MDLVQTLDALVLRQEAVERQLEQAAGSGVSLDALLDQQRKLGQAEKELAEEENE
jgi:hypothetical protein